ncbi:MAG: tetratricopeptide repeat protein [Planctomycetota bacterium]
MFAAWIALVPCLSLGLAPSLRDPADPPAPQAPPALPPDAKVIVKYPDDPRLDQALVMMAQGEFEVASVACRTVLNQHPDVDRAAMLLGLALSKSKRYEEARPLLERARDSKQQFPERMHAAHFLGWACFHLGELECAKASFEAHLKAVPKEPDSTFGLGLVALAEDRLDDAARAFDESLAGFTAPKPRPADQARVLVRMADLALRNGDAPRAEALLERAVRANPVQPEAWSKLARVYDRLEKPAKADAARANEQRILESMGRREAAKPPASPPDAPAQAPQGGDAAKDAKP